MLKPILPSLKEKKRYIQIEGKVSQIKVKEAIKSFIGELGYAKAGVKMVKTDIIQVNSKYKDEIISALALKNIKTKKTSGMINKLGKEEN